MAGLWTLCSESNSTTDMLAALDWTESTVIAYAAVVAPGENVGDLNSAASVLDSANIPFAERTSVLRGSKGMRATAQCNVPIYGTR